MTSLLPSFRYCTLWLGVALVAGTVAHARDIRRGLPIAMSRILVNASGVSSDTLMAALAAENAMLADVVKMAAGGDIAGAWETMTADIAGEGNPEGITPDRVGWRAATVVGFLQNQSSYEAADLVAKIALNAEWCRRPANDDICYWCARIAYDGLGDQDLAIRWIGSQRSDEAPRIGELRSMLENGGIHRTRSN
jgi:hypothetical protein